MQRQLATPSPVRHQPAKRRGFNLVEAAIVLGVVGLVIGGLWVAASSVMFNRKLSATQAGILYSAKEAERIFSIKLDQVGRDNTIMDPAAIRSGVAPKDWVSGTNITHPFGGQVTYETDNAEPAGWGSFAISLYSLTVPQCIQILVGTTRESQPLAVYVYNTSYGFQFIGSGRIDVSTAESYCADSLNMLQFHFPR